MSDNDFFGGRRRRRAGAAFSPYSLFANGEQGVWYDPSDLTPEKVSWRRNLLTYSQDFENAAWTKSNASILSNLALYSQDFDNAAWAKTGATITANSTTAPDSTTTADTLTEDTSLGQHRALQALAVTASLTYTMSFYVKANGRTRVSIFDNASASDTEMIFDISNGTVVRTGAAVVASSIVALSNGWYRISASSTPSTASMQSAIRLVQSGTTSSYTGDGTSGIFLWGAQVVPGSTAQTYTRSLATAAPIQFADPLGGTLADKLIENTANASHYAALLLNTIVAGTRYVQSVYAKAGERNWVWMTEGNNVTAQAYFDVANGVVGTVSGTGSPVATITSVGDGWYRCSLAFTPVAAAANTQVRLASGDNTGTYLGNGTSGAYIFGAQIEQASTASAYQRITDFSSDFLAAFPTHALYQESTGVTPVTALGQSVGLVLDKRLGGASNLGAELVSNGDFSNGSTGWTTTNWIVSGGAAEVINATDSIAQNISLTAGKTYRVTYTVRSFSGTGGVRPRFFGGTTVTGTTVSSAGTFSEYLVAVTGNTQVAIASTSSTCAIIVDNISVREVPGNHAIQATSASRPTLQARSNLLIASEQFDTWASVSTCNVTANSTTAPDGATTADTLTPTTSGSLRSRSSTFTGDGEKAFSIYLKAGTSPFSLLRIFDATAAVFRHTVNVTWTNGVPTLATGAGAGTLYPVEALANGWYRILFSATGIVAANDNQFRIQPDPSGATLGTLIAWGAQAENATVPTTYQRVVTATDYADVGLPRNLTFDGVDDSLATAGNVDFATWTVGTRRNLLTVPTMFDDAAWVKTNATVTANTSAAPDGTTTADKLIPALAATDGRVIQTVTGGAAGVTYTFSAYGKAVDSGFADFRLYVDDSASNSARVSYNILTGVVTSSAVTTGTWTAASSTITDVGNGWYRVTITFTTTAAALTRAMVWCRDAGNATNGILLWGAQLETGSTATAFQDVGTDKVSLFSGLFKASDAAIGMVTELSASVSLNNGTFYLSAPNSAAGTNYAFVSKGTSSASQTTSATAPDTAVVTGLGNIGAPSAIIRRNGVQSSNATTQGTGNYGTYPLYVGRRGGSTLPFNGRLFQLVIRGAATDSVTVGNAERWVGQLTGVTL